MDGQRQPHRIAAPRRPNRVLPDGAQQPTREVEAVLGLVKQRGERWTVTLYFRIGRRARFYRHIAGDGEKVRTALDAMRLMTRTFLPPTSSSALADPPLPEKPKKTRRRRLAEVVALDPAARHRS